MRTIGIIGGMSWESSLEYYRILNQEMRARLGGHHSARLLMLSVDFAPVVALQHDGDWTALGDEMAAAAQALERGGAGCVLIATNTMHLLADRVAAAVAIPLLHIGDAAGRAVAAAGHRRVGLLGTAFTMEQPFYADRLARHGLEVLVPEADDRGTIHRIIYEELVAGRIEPSSRQAYRAVIARLVDRGAQAIVLGCTEIMLLIGDDDSAVPLFDTTRLHALAAIDWALA